MKPPRKSYKKRIGNHALTIAPYTHCGTGAQMWRFGYKPDPKGSTKYVTRSSWEAIEAEAERILNERNDGELDWNSLTPERRKFLETIHRLTPLPEDEEEVLEALKHYHQQL